MLAIGLRIRRIVTAHVNGLPQEEIGLLGGDSDVEHERVLAHEPGYECVSVFPFDDWPRDVESLSFVRGQIGSLDDALECLAKPAIRVTRVDSSLEELEHPSDHAVETVDSFARDARSEPHHIAPVSYTARD